MGALRRSPPFAVEQYEGGEAIGVGSGEDPGKRDWC